MAVAMKQDVERVVETVYRGEIWMIHFHGVGSEQTGVRPALITSNNIGNKFAPIVSAAPITSKPKRVLPTHVYLEAAKHGTNFDSVILLEQNDSVDKGRLLYRVGMLDTDTMKQVDKGLKIALGIEE